MASGDAWSAGWNLGANLAGQRHAQKQERSNELWEDQRNQLKSNIANLAAKYSSQLGPNGEATPASLQTKYILQQAELHKDLFEKPIQGPGAIERLGWLLHLSKRPQAHTTTFQTPGEPIPGAQVAAPSNPPAADDKRFAVPAGEPANPVLLARTGTPASAPASNSPEAAPTAPASQAAEETPPAQPATPEDNSAAPEQNRQTAADAASLKKPVAATPPTGPAHTYAIKVPGLTQKQLQQQAQARYRAQQATEELTAAAPLSPEQQATRQAHAQSAGTLTSLKDTLDAVDQFFPPDEREKARQNVRDRAFGGTAATAGKWDRVPGKMNGQPTTLLYNEKTGEYRAQTGESVDSELLKTFVADPKSAAGAAKAAWSKDEKGRIYSANLDPATHQEIPGTRNYNMVPPASLTGRISTGQFHYVDENGAVHEVQETRTSTPIRGGGGPAPAAASAASGGTGAPPPAGAGNAVRHAHTPAARPASRGAGAARDNIIGWKGTKEYSDLRTQYHGALSRKETMDKNLAHALQGDQQAMLSLVANHIGMTLGAQKGARINQAVWNEAVASAPWIEASASKWFHRDPSTNDLIFDGFKSGVTLTPDQMRSMVALAHEQVDTVKESLDRLTAEQRPSPGGAPASTAGGGKSLADRLSEALGGK